MLHVLGGVYDRFIHRITIHTVNSNLRSRAYWVSMGLCREEEGGDR